MLFPANIDARLAECETTVPLLYFAHDSTYAVGVTVRKAVPIVLRGEGLTIDILVFEHPRAGTQLVKGTIEPGESATNAALRELWEESGIGAARIARDLGVWGSPKGQAWHFHEVLVDGTLPENWEHFTQDGGGKLFRFRWHRLVEEPSATWHPIHRDALEFVRAALRKVTGS
jgi:8-oxo-dGTP pyrophosphatase MutT (NUDIX family)